MVKIDKVYKRLENEFYDFVTACRFDGVKDQQVPLSYMNFEQILMKDGFVLCEKTVLSKWKVLKASGIIKEIPYTGGKALLQIDALVIALGYAALDEKKKEKKIFSEEEASA